jgi:hypothetical protein
MAGMGLADFIGGIVGFVLTLCVFSYILGDNLLFRLAIHIFIGVAAAYAAVMVWYNVIWTQLVLPLLSGQLALLIPLLLSFLLLAKIAPRFSGLGNPVMAYLVGVGAAAAVGGAVFGTIFPQAGASANLFDHANLLQGKDTLDYAVNFFNSGIILVGTLTTLVYFHFGVRGNDNFPQQRPLLLRGVSWVGQAFIAVTFGALFAGVYAAAVTALIERWTFLVEFILGS